MALRLCRELKGSAHSGADKRTKCVAHVFTSLIDLRAAFAIFQQSTLLGPWLICLSAVVAASSWVVMDSIRRWRNFSRLVSFAIFGKSISRQSPPSRAHFARWAIHRLRRVCCLVADATRMMWSSASTYSSFIPPPRWQRLRCIVYWSLEAPNAPNNASS